MHSTESFSKNHEVLKLRLETLIRIRWLAIIGQFLAVVIVAFGLGFQFYISLCLAVIACSAWLNIFLGLRYRADFRVSENAVVSLLAFDILQLGLLLYLTGGLRNPFAMLLMVPVIISATAQSSRQTLLLGTLAIIAICFLAFNHLPLPWYPGESFDTPQLIVFGTGLAIVSGLVFTGFYAFRLADESRKLSNALLATEVILQREQYLSSLDGLAAAAAHELGTPLATIALVSKEMVNELPADSPFAEDARLLRSQAARCREILQKLTSLSNEGEDHIGTLSLASLVDEIVEPHRNFGIQLETTIENRMKIPNRYANFVRNSAMIYGLGNLVENAVDFANNRVEIIGWWNEESVTISICDDGAGFPRELIGRIGEPYISTRSEQEQTSGGGLGLGLFIAKTLLERSGATLEFANGDGNILPGARVTVSWSRAHLDQQLQSFSQRER